MMYTSCIKALVLSCHRGQLEVVKWLMENTALSTNSNVTYMASVALKEACESAALNVATWVVEHTVADVNHVDDKTRNTALHYVVSCSNAKFNSGRTRLHEA